MRPVSVHSVLSSNVAEQRVTGHGKASFIWFATTPLGKMRESYTYHPPGATTKKRLSLATGVEVEPVWKLESTYEYDEYGRSKTLT
jgi:hypothetical protein